MRNLFEITMFLSALIISLPLANNSNKFPLYKSFSNLCRLLIISLLYKKLKAWNNS